MSTLSYMSELDIEVQQRLAGEIWRLAVAETDSANRWAELGDEVREDLHHRIAAYWFRLDGVQIGSHQPRQGDEFVLRWLRIPIERRLLAAAKQAAAARHTNDLAGSTL